MQDNRNPPNRVYIYPQGPATPQQAATIPNHQAPNQALVLVRCDVIKRLETSVDNQQTLIQTLQTQNATQQQIINNLKAQQAALMKNLSLRASEIQELLTRNASLNTLFQQAIKDITARDIQIMVYQKEIQPKAIAEEYKAALAQQKKQIADLNNEIDSLKQQLEKLQAEKASAAAPMLLTAGPKQTSRSTSRKPKAKIPRIEKDITRCIRSPLEYWQTTLTTFSAEIISAEAGHYTIRFKFINDQKYSSALSASKNWPSRIGDFSDYIKTSELKDKFTRITCTTRLLNSHLTINITFLSNYIFTPESIKKFTSKQSNDLTFTPEDISDLSFSPEDSDHFKRIKIFVMLLQKHLRKHTKKNRLANFYLQVSKKQVDGKEAYEITNPKAMQLEIGEDDRAYLVPLSKNPEVVSFLDDHASALTPSRQPAKKTVIQISSSSDDTEDSDSDDSDPDYVSTSPMLVEPTTTTTTTRTTKKRKGEKADLDDAHKSKRQKCQESKELPPAEDDISQFLASLHSMPRDLPASPQPEKDDSNSDQDSMQVTTSLNIT